MQRFARAARPSSVPAAGVSHASRALRVLRFQQHHANSITRAAAEVSTPEASAPIAVADAPDDSKAAEPQAAAKAVENSNGSKEPSKKAAPSDKATGKDGASADNKTPARGDRAIVTERTKLLLKGEAVGVSMAPTPQDLAVGFKGLRPLSRELERKDHTLLFFPSVQPPKDEQPEAAAEETNGDGAPQQGQQKRGDRRRRRQQQATDAKKRVLDLAMVAVPKFDAPKPEVTIRVGAKSDSAAVARTLTRSLLQSSSVAVHAAGPAAALVAVQAAVMTRTALGSAEQLDLAFSIEYLRVPAIETGKPPSGAEEAAAATAAAAGNGADDAKVEGSAAAAAPAPPPAPTPAAPTNILQFSFYKRALPTPEINVSDFAPARDVAALSELLTSLMGERREVEVILGSRDALFAVQAVSRAVRECWQRHNASVGLFLASLEPSPSEPDQHFTARLQLRRIPGAPNLVSASGGGRQRQSLLGAPLGTVKWNTPIAPLASAINRELDSAGVYSVLPEEGVCVARLLRSVWEAQRQRASAFRAAGADAVAAVPADTDAAAAAAAAEAPSSSLMQIAIVPESQSEGLTFTPVENPGTAVSDVEGDDDDGGEGRRRRRRDGPERRARATVIHLVEVTPILASTLRQQPSTEVAISGGEQLVQMVKAVVLRNRMYGTRRGGKVLVLRPSLDSTGALSVRFEYVSAAAVADVPPPPTSQRQGRAPAANGVAAGDDDGAAAAAAAAARLFDAGTPPSPAAAAADFVGGYATDDEYGVGAEAAVLMPEFAMAAVAQEEQHRQADVAGGAAAAAAGGGPADAAAAAAGPAVSKSPWLLYVNTKTNSRNLALDIVAETCKPYDRLSPAWLRVLTRPSPVATAVLAVGQAQPQVQERANVQLQVLPVIERKRDEKNRPVNYLTLRLLKEGPGAAPGAAAALAAAAGSGKEAPSAEGGRRRRGKAQESAVKVEERKGEPAGPSAAAMAAAAAAAAKYISDGDAMLSGTRKLW